MHSRSARPQRETYFTESGLVVGFLALTVAILVAHGSPITNYELSIYEATPQLVWASVGVALALALVIALFARQRRNRLLALVLAGGAVLVVAALPLLRNYYFYGLGDALIHLGWARDIAAGELGTFELFYPGLHTATVISSRLLAISLPTAMLFVVLGFLLVYLLFVPLCVRELTDRPGALVVGCFAALLVLPVNHVAIQYMSPHPISGSILLSPLVLYLLLRYVDGDVGPSMGVSLVGGLLALSLVAILLYHTMQAANLLAMFGGIVALQFFARRWSDSPAAGGTRPLYGHTVFLAVVFVVWNLQFSVVSETLWAVERELVELVFGAAAPAAVVSSRSASLTGLGVGLSEIFLKLFLPSAVFAVLAAGIVGYSIRRWGDRSLTGVRVLGAGLVGFSLTFVLFLPGNVSKLLFRNLGFLMVIATVLGAGALVALLGGRDRFEHVGLLRRGTVAVVLAVLLVGSMLVVFPSPHIYQANSGLDAAEMQGYETAFEQRDSGVQFVGIRSGIQREVRAIYGTVGVPEDLDSFGFYRNSGMVTGEELQSLAEAVEEPRYLVVTRQDRLQELGAYRGLRYTEAQFDAIDNQRGVSRVYTNGPFTLYRITPTGAA